MRFGGADDSEVIVPLKSSGSQKQQHGDKVDLGIDYNFGFDTTFLKRCKRIYGIALPKPWSFDGLMVALLLINIFPPMGTQFLFAILPGWTMRTLIDRNFHEFAASMVATGLVGLLDAFLSGLNFWLSLYVSIRLRKRLTEAIQERYCNHKHLYYHMAVRDNRIDNPDARIQTDASQATVGLVTVLCIIVSGSLQVLIYTAYVTYKVGWHGTLIIYVYYLITAMVNKLMMSPIVALTYNQDRLEGHFRFEHARLRTMAEAVAFSNGHMECKQSLHQHLKKVLKNQTKNIFWQSWLNLFTNFVGNGNGILGYCIAAFTIFTVHEYQVQQDSGALGEVITQLTSVIGNLTGAFGSLISAAPMAASLAGNASRVGQMLEVMDDIEDHADEYQDQIATQKTANGALISFVHLNAFLADGAPIVKDFCLDVFPSKCVVIRGPSGCGKTTLLRYLRGLWYVGPNQGHVTTSLQIGDAGIMFLPQRPYFNQGTLQSQIEFPRPDPTADVESWEDIALGQCDGLLERLRLSHLKDENGWNREKAWQDVLSLGEMQQLSILRVLYHRPQLVCLDESTSAMSVEMEEICYSMLREAGITYLSVAHRPSVVQYHDVVVTLDGAGGWRTEKTQRK